MGQISMEIMLLPGSVLDGNQHILHSSSRSTITQHVRIVAEQTLSGLPGFRAPFWRSVFGLALNRLSEPGADSLWPKAIVPRMSDGPARRALYSLIFAPETGAGAGPGRSVPPPLVFDGPLSPHSLKPGDTEIFALTLIGGAAAAALPAVVAALHLACQEGLGAADAFGHRGRARLADASVTWRDGGGLTSVFGPDDSIVLVPARTPELPPCPEAVRVTLATPLRLIRNGRLVGPQTIAAGDLVDALVRRVSTLQRVYGTAPPEADFGQLLVAARALPTIDPDLARAEPRRWSASQEQEIELAGVVGSLTIDLRHAAALWPYLWLGQWVHAGKGTSMGLGAMRLARF
jgi:CRISPR-associated endoribonuclease Cas6